MNPSEDEIVAALRRVDPPASTGLPADLWPRMQRRLDDRHSRFHFDWFDRLVVLSASVSLLLNPRAMTDILSYL